MPDLSIFYGKYLVNQRICHNCGASWPVASEKMTDVNIAVELLSDAFQDRFDVALLLSADSDLTGPVRTIRSLFPSKRVVVAFPPGRASYDLQQVAHASFTIGEGKLKGSLLPTQIVKAGGYVLRKPIEWS